MSPKKKKEVTPPAERKARNEKPFSLHPLKLRDALHKALNTKPPRKNEGEEEPEE